MKFSSSQKSILVAWIVAIVFIVFAGGMVLLYSNDNDSSLAPLTTESIDIDNNLQSYILNTVNLAKMLYPLITASGVSFNNYDPYNEPSDLSNFLNAIAQQDQAANPNQAIPLATLDSGGMKGGIPLIWNIVSAKKLPGSTDYNLKLLVGLNLDERSTADLNVLFQNQNLIKKYDPYFNFGFVTQGPSKFLLNDDIATNSKPLLIDVNLTRPQVNGVITNWQTIDIGIDPRNKLEALLSNS